MVWGVTHNTTFNKESRAAIFLEQYGSRVRGCLLVYPPLGGSGSIAGTLDSSTFFLQERTSSFTITFRGQVTGEKISGNYVVVSPTPPVEIGTMAMTKSRPILANINASACPSDADNRAWAG